MQLREIYIDGFGVFCDKHVTALSSGINVLYGPNEFGKSTLLAFIRRMLFGFHVSTNENQYPLISGGVYGGRIVCQLANTKLVTISRKEGRNGGPIKVITDSAELSGQEELNKIIGQITEKFYENVYAIGLDELQALKTLEEGEIRNHIYGAGLELGGVSLTEIQNTFQKQSDGIFKTGGSVQKIPSLYKEIREKEKAIAESRKLLSCYDDFVNQRDNLQAQFELLDDEIGKVQQDQRLLKAQQSLFPTYVKLKIAEAKLAAIGETTQFKEYALPRLNEMETVILNINKQIQSDTIELNELQRDRDALLYDERIIEFEHKIITLQKKTESYKSAFQDIGAVKSQIVMSVTSIRAKIAKLGSGWTEDSVRNFNLSHLDEDQSRIARAKIDEANRKIVNVKSKLEAYLDSKASEESQGGHITPFFRNTGYLSIAVGAAGISLGFVLRQPVLSVFSACLLVVGLVLTLYGRRQNLSPELTPLEKQYMAEISSAESDQKKVFNEWQEQLSKMGLDEKLSPDGSVDVIKTIKDIQSDQNILAGLDSRRKAMQDAINEVNSLLNSVVASLDRLNISDDVIANIEILVQLLNAAKTSKSERENFDKQIDKKESKIRNCREDLEGAEKDLRSFIAAFNATDVTDFRSKHQVFREQESLKKIVEEYRNTIQSIVGIDEHYDEFLEQISITDPVAISTELDARDKSLREKQKERDEKKERIGELRSKIEGLSATDLAEDQTRLEVKKQQLNDYSKEWVRNQIALYALAKAISKYETTRQPEVIKAATSVFSKITDHKYPLIIKPTGSDEIVIQGNSAKRKTIKEMSRGTREQLYLAMRLGLISAYEKLAEPMPIIMDDILVNFDDGRGRAAIAGLMEFATNRQIIVLTCHKNTLDIYKSMTAKELDWGGLPIDNKTPATKESINIDSISTGDVQGPPPSIIHNEVAASSPTTEKTLPTLLKDTIETSTPYISSVDNQVPGKTVDLESILSNPSTESGKKDIPVSNTVSEKSAVVPSDHGALITSASAPSHVDRHSGGSIDPESRGGSPRGSRMESPVKEPTEKKEIQLNSQIVGWKRERCWELAIEIVDMEQESDLIKVAQTEYELEHDDSRQNCYLLKSLSASVDIRREIGDISIKETIKKDDYLILKLKSKDLDEGVAVRGVSYGNYLIITPADWKWNTKDFGEESVAPEPVSITGYTAHYYRKGNLKDAVPTFVTPNNGIIHLTSIQPRFVLKGLMLDEDAVAIGTLFGQKPPTLYDSSGKQWGDINKLVIIGEGENKGWRTAFSVQKGINNQELPEDLVKRQGGWYTVRIYDLKDVLVESLDFRFLTCLKSIQIEKYPCLPPDGGHKVLTISFSHDKYFEIFPENIQENIPIDSSDSLTVIKIPPKHALDNTHWSIRLKDTKATQISYLLSIKRAWWTLGTTKNHDLNWQDQPVHLSKSDFSPTAQKAIWLTFPEDLIGQKFGIGFGGNALSDKNIFMKEQILCVPLKDIGNDQCLSKMGLYQLIMRLNHDPNNHVTLGTLNVCACCSKCDFETRDNSQLQKHIKDEHKDEYLVEYFRHLTYDEMRVKVPGILPLEIYECGHCFEWVNSHSINSATSAIIDHQDYECKKVDRNRGPISHNFRIVKNMDDIIKKYAGKLPYIRKCCLCNKEIKEATDDDQINHLIEMHIDSLFILK